MLISTRSSKPSRFWPAATKSGRWVPCASAATRLSVGESSARAGFESGVVIDSVEHDVDVAGRRQVLANRVDHFRGDGGKLALVDRRGKLERRVRLQIALGVERARQRIAFDLRHLR